MPHMVMTHEKDPKDAILADVGDIDDLKVFHNHVVLAIYMRPEKTASGIILPDQYRDEDRHQSKVGLVIKMGDDAFTDDTGRWFNGISVGMHDWIVFRPSDGWSITINGVLCRCIRDVDARASVSHPDMVW